MSPVPNMDRNLMDCAVDAVKWIDRQYKIAKMLGFKELKTVIEPGFDGYKFALIELYGCAMYSDDDVKNALYQAMSIVRGASDAEI